VSRLTEAVAAGYAELTPQERRVADVIRAHADAVVLYNSTELAQLAGVSKATVSRLFRRLGFSGSQEVRESLRAQRSAGVPVRTAEPAEPSDVVARILADAELLRRLAATVDIAAVERVVRLLADAQRVLIIGHRTGFPLALAFRSQLAQARDGVRVAPLPGQSLGEELEGLTARDVILLVGVRRRPADFSRLLADAARSSATTVLVTDPSGQRFTGVLDETLVCPLDSASPFDSAAAFGSLLGAVADGVHAALGPRAEERATAIARRYSSLRETEER